MPEYRIIDGDCHVVEPPHIWERWLPEQYQDRAPKLVKDEAGGDAWSFGPGVPIMKIGLVATPGMRFEEMKNAGYTYETVRKGCFDGKARLEDMDFDGVDAEFIYPSQRTMMHFMRAEKDRDFHRAGIRAYNDYMAKEFCSVDPERLFFLAQMPNLGVEECMAELERCRKMGARGCIVTSWPSGNDELSGLDEPFFAAAQDLAMPVSIHVMLQKKRTQVSTSTEGPGAIGYMALGGMLFFPPVMCELVMSGLFDRLPKLKIVGVETEVGWIPEALEQVDNFYWRNRTHTGVEIKHLPSHYFHEHFVCTFITDRTGIRNRYEIGVKNMAWSSDYPHLGCDWPYSRKVINEMMDGVAADERHAILAGNMIELYGLEPSYRG